MNEQNNSVKRSYFDLYLDAETTINSAHDTLTAALCAIDSVESRLIDESLGDETISALYGICSIIRNCRNDLAKALDKGKAVSMSANCE